MPEPKVDMKVELPFQGKKSNQKSRKGYLSSAYLLYVLVFENWIQLLNK